MNSYSPSEPEVVWRFNACSGLESAILAPETVAPLLSVTVQIKNDQGICWDASYPAPAFQNDEFGFRDKSE